MSAGYADRLSKGYDYGECGQPERVDGERRRELVLSRLVKLIRDAKYIVAHTGAGISTSCGIPDFRGPRGVWTMEKKGLPRVDSSLDKEWEAVIPSKTHMALVALHRVGKLRFIVTQNVDALHLRSGFERKNVAELHGNVMKETCGKCGAEYFRHFDVKGMGFKETGRLCNIQTCGGALRDELLDWEDSLPEPDLEISELHCRRADLSLCLGTSLRVMPANGLPLMTKRKGGSLAIVNLQATQFDGQCDVKVHGYVDEILEEVMKRLGIPIPEYDPGLDFVAQKRDLVFSGRLLSIPDGITRARRLKLTNNKTEEKIKEASKKESKKRSREPDVKHESTGLVEGDVEENSRDRKKIKKEES